MPLFKRNFGKVVNPFRFAGPRIVSFARIRSSAGNTDKRSRNKRSSKVVHELVDLPDTAIQDHESAEQANDVVEAQETRDDAPAPHEGLDTLPLELLIEIIKYLDWKRVLQVRKTCRALYTATTTKPIWQHLHTSLSSTSSIKSTFKFDRPLCLLTSRDLEAAFLRRTGVPLGWTRAGLRRVRQRDVVDEEARRFHLVPGGRWLLVATVTGSVWCHDLDDPDIRERELIPDQVGWNDGNIVVMDVDVDEEQEVLTFMVVLAIREQQSGYLYGRYGENMAYVWKVTLQLDEEGRGIGLSATRSALLTLEKHGCIQSLSILGPLICYRVSSSKNPQPNYFAIFDWAKEYSEVAKEKGQAHTHTGNHRWVIYTDQSPAKMRILPENQVVLASNGHVKLYKLKDIPLQDIHAIQPDQIRSPTASSWTSSQIPSLIAQSLSQPFLVTTKPTMDTDTDTDTGSTRTSKSVRLVLFSHRGVHGLYFPLNDSWADLVPVPPFPPDLDHSPLPLIVKLMDYTPGPSDCDYAVGYNRTMVKHYRPQVDMLRYSWPDDAEVLDPVILPKKIACGSWHRATPFIDESSGRIVISSDGGMRIVVLDTSLYDTNTI